jgi:hypothetical protein
MLDAFRRKSSFFYDTVRMEDAVLESRQERLAEVGHGCGVSGFGLRHGCFGLRPGVELAHLCNFDFPRFSSMDPAPWNYKLHLRCRCFVTSGGILAYFHTAAGENISKKAALKNFHGYRPHSNSTRRFHNPTRARSSIEGV